MQTGHADDAVNVHGTGLLLAPEKIAGPTRKITYLGIQIDTEHMTISLRTEKYTKLMAQLRTWGKRNKCKKKGAAVAYWHFVIRSEGG